MSRGWRYNSVIGVLHYMDKPWVPFPALNNNNNDNNDDDYDDDDNDDNDNDNV